MKHSGLLLALVLSFLASSAHGQAFNSPYWNFTGWNQNQILSSGGQTFDVFGDESLWVTVTGSVSGAGILSSGSATGFNVGTSGGPFDSITLNFMMDSIQNISFLSGETNHYEYINLDGTSFIPGDVVSGYNPYIVIDSSHWTGVNGPYAYQWLDSVDPTNSFSYTYIGPIVQTQKITSEAALVDLGGGVVPEPSAGLLAMTTACLFLLQRRRQG